MNLESNRALYISIWKAASKALLGWTEDITNEWSHKYEEGLNSTGRDPWFYHQTPIWYLVPLLVPNTLQNRADVNTLQLEGRLQEAIECNDPLFEQLEEYDWQAARARVEAVLGEFGESLTTLRSHR